jgi:hypothetical protein
MSFEELSVKVLPIVVSMGLDITIEFWVSGFFVRVGGFGDQEIGRWLLSEES